MKLLIPFFLLFALLIGALGLKTVGECDSNPRISDQMQCYHVAGMTQAYLGNYDSGKEICDNIWNKFGASINPQAPGASDQRKKAELIANACFFDIAKISRKPQYCAYITQHNDVQTQLFGDKVTIDICTSEVQELAKSTPENYYGSKNNICQLVFILPMFVIVAIRK